MNFVADESVDQGIATLLAKRGPSRAAVVEMEPGLTDDARRVGRKGSIALARGIGTHGIDWQIPNAHPRWFNHDDRARRKQSFDLRKVGNECVHD
jgi:hypothetical protein